MGAARRAPPPFVAAAAVAGIVVLVGGAVLGGDVLVAEGDLDDNIPIALGPTLVLEAGDRPGSSDAGPDEPADPDGDRSFPTGYDALDQLDPATVLGVRVSGFSRFAAGRAMQCVTTVDTVCANEIPVQFAEDGSAEFQYLVTDRFAPEAEQGRCRALAAPCSIVVEEIDGDDRAERHTVFTDPSPFPGIVRVEPRTGLDDGDDVSVEVTDLPPGSVLAATICAAPHVVGGSHCDDPTTAAQIRVGPDGSGSTIVTVRSGAVGTEGTRCGGRHPRPCGISVWSPELWPRVPVVPLEFARPPGPRYDVSRLSAGLATAVALIAAAGWLARRTDWSAIGEVAAPEIDDASYADLDAIVAALPPEPEDGAPT